MNSLTCPRIWLVDDTIGGGIVCAEASFVSGWSIQTQKAINTTTETNEYLFRIMHCPPN